MRRAATTALTIRDRPRQALGLSDVPLDLRFAAIRAWAMLRDLLVAPRILSVKLELEGLFQ